MSYKPTFLALGQYVLDTYAKIAKKPHTLNIQLLFLVQIVQEIL